MTLPLRWRCALGLLFAMAAGFAYLLVSERVGRLSMDLQYDDVTYALDAVLRLDALQYGGIGELVRGLVLAPPHAPVSTLQAASAFRLAGEHEFIFYASNLAWVLAAALFVVVVARRAGDRAFFLSLAFVLVSSLAYATQAEYRPDGPLGLATAAMLWTFASAAIDERPRRLRWAGVLLGIALLVKPSFFAHTLALALLAAAAGFLAARRRAPAWLRPLALPTREIAWFFVIAMVVSSPYFAPAAAETVEYFWSNTFGHRGKIWNLGQDLSWWQVLEQFKPFAFAVPRYHLGVAAAAGAIFAVLLLWRGERREALRVTALWLAAATSGAIIVAGRQPNPFFFGSMDWLFVASAIAGYAAFDSTLAPRARLALFTALAIGMLPLAAANFRDRPGAWPDEAKHGASWNVRLLGHIREDLKHVAPGPPPAVHAFLDTAGPVNAVTFRWVARLNGLTLTAQELQIYANLTELREFALASDYLVLANPAVIAFDKPLPVGTAQRYLLDWALGRSDFERVDGDDPDAKYVVFANRAMTRRFTAPGVPATDGSVLSTRGLSGEPQARPRRMEGREAQACFVLPVGRPMRLAVRFRGDGPGALVLRREGETLARGALAAGQAGELSAPYTAVIFDKNCFDLRVEGAAGAPPPRVEIEAFDLRAAPPS